MKDQIVVTGGDGMLGRAVIRELLDEGFDVLSIDRVRTPDRKLVWVADVRDPAVLMQACAGCAGVVHLAAHIAPNLAADHETFLDNITMTYNALNSAWLLRVPRVVIASSIAAYGFLYGDRRRTPSFLPIDETHPPLPTDPYGQSKVAGEMLADSFAEKGIEAIASLRFPGINYDPAFRRIESFMNDPAYRAPGFWSYLDVRDAARACVAALRGGVRGHRIYNVAAPDSNMRESTRELIERHFPSLRELRSTHQTNWSGIDSSRIERELGFVARFSWKDVL